MMVAEAYRYEEAAEVGPDRRALSKVQQQVVLTWVSRTSSCAIEADGLRQPRDGQGGRHHRRPGLLPLHGRKALSWQRDDDRVKLANRDEAIEAILSHCSPAVSATRAVLEGNLHGPAALPGGQRATCVIVEPS